MQQPIEEPAAAPRVWVATADDLARARPRLSEVLRDCVEGGASVGFLAPLSPDEADDFWRRVESTAAAGRRIVLLATAHPDDDEIAGTVQLDVATPANQPHRATVSKLLVHSSARRRGIGEALMVEAERVAREAGRWLLVLDTATPAAERLYQRAGWTASGVIPAYALNPDRTLTHTTYYWKDLREERDEP